MEKEEEEPNRVVAVVGAENPAESPAENLRNAENPAENPRNAESHADAEDVNFINKKI